MEIRKTLTPWIMKIAKPVIPGVLLITLIAMAESLCGVVLALQSKQVIDVAVSGNPEGLKVSALLFGLMICFQLLLSFLYMKISANLVSKHTLKLQNKIFAEAMGMDYKSFSQMHTGKLLNRITTDADVVMCALIGIVPAVCAFVTGIISSVGALIIIQPAFALVCISIGIVVGIGASVWGRLLKKHTLVCRSWADRVNSFMLECLHNLPVIKSFCNEGRVVKHAAHIQANSYKALKKRNFNNIMASLASEFAFTFGYFLALGWGAFSIALGTLSYGSVMAMVQLVGKIQAPFKGIASVVPQFYQMLASAERLMDVVNNKEEISSGEEIGDFDSIKFNNVSFSYNEKDFVLRDVDLEIKKGDFLLVSGISGIGKSTLLKLLLSMYKPGIGNIDILYNEKIIPLGEKHRSLFAYVPQGNMILSGTVEENVMFFAKGDFGKTVEECLKAAELWEDVSKMPNGIKTVVGERGIGLSEGQTQRLAVARALYRNTPILLLDEATSALDAVAEAKMLENIRNIKGKTCILISHKTAAEAYMTKKLVINDGFVEARLLGNADVSRM